MLGSYLSKSADLKHSGFKTFPKKPLGHTQHGCQLLNDFPQFFTCQAQVLAKTFEELAKMFIQFLADFTSSDAQSLNLIKKFPGPEIQPVSGSANSRLRGAGQTWSRVLCIRFIRFPKARSKSFHFVPCDSSHCWSCKVAVLGVFHMLEACSRASWSFLIFLFGRPS